MHPRRYEIGSDGRIVLVELTSDETLEFEVFEQSIADNGDGDEVKAQPAMEPLLHWLGRPDCFPVPPLRETQHVRWLPGFRLSQSAAPPGSTTSVPDTEAPQRELLC